MRERGPNHGFNDVMTLENRLIKEINKILLASDLKQLSRFGMIGILNTILGYGLFVIFLNWCSYFWALVFSHIIAVTHSYLWNRFWTFKSYRNPLKEFIKFNSVYLMVFFRKCNYLIPSGRCSKFRSKNRATICFADNYYNKFCRA